MKNKNGMKVLSVFNNFHAMKNENEYKFFLRMQKEIGEKVTVMSLYRNTSVCADTEDVRALVEF
jgi:hypothetical protein